MENLEIEKGANELVIEKIIGIGITEKLKKESTCISLAGFSFMRRVPISFFPARQK